MEAADNDSSSVEVDAIPSYVGDVYAEALVFGILSDVVEVPDGQTTETEYDRGLEFVNKGATTRPLKGILMDELETMKLRKSKTETRDKGEDGSRQQDTDLTTSFKATTQCDREWELSLLDLNNRVALIQNAVDEFPTEPDPEDEDEDDLRIKDLLSKNNKLVNMISRTLYNPRDSPFPSQLATSAETFIREVKSYSSEGR